MLIGCMPNYGHSVSIVGYLAVFHFLIDFLTGKCYDNKKGVFVLLFEHIHFHGEFRDYQSRVLAKADQYLADGKINIVAAPGSGKTVLGLELIRRIGEPCLIFSPTTAIREQWGERFRDLFLDEKSDFPRLFSTNLRDIKLLNSLTYQALFTAMEKTDLCEDGDDCYADVDIIDQIRKNHIGTICLDEAHHLKNEWQRSLEKLISIVGDQVKIIALTATPPYDSEGNEWSRYLAMCGEVDEEIFVPELVARDTLCPHQDYIYFNYPTAEEIAALKVYRENARKAVAEVGALGFMPGLADRIYGEADIDKLFSSAKEYIALLVLLKHYGFKVNQKQIRSLLGRKGLPAYKLKFAETALRFLLEGDCLAEVQKEEMIAIFKTYAVYHKRKLSLVMQEKLKRSLISSVGKLDSIAKIAKSEYVVMGERLRMLVLTDYIKKESVTQITKTEAWSDISVVSIFETLRRSNEKVSIGVLSGTLVILPDTVKLEGIKHTRTPIAETNYSVIDIAGSAHCAVKAVGELFEKGKIQILVGTKALLGEGWDAPCINALIMASFVGSYVLSNQMRGRAIRIDKNNPDKTSNIWHLVTVEPEYLFEESKIDQVKKYLSPEKKELISYDYDILKRRFDSFMGPNYDLGTIESGIERITAVKPPYDKSGIERINDTMLKLSKDRNIMREKWTGEVKDGSFAVALETEVDKEKRVPVFTFSNIALLLVLVIIELTFLRQFFISLADMLAILETNPSITIIAFLGFAVFSALICYAGYRISIKMILHFNPARSVKTIGIAVYRTLVECGCISSSAKVETDEDKYLRYIGISLRNASIHDQNIFNTAMAELLSPIENPRYILIRQRRFAGYDFKYAFACPSVLGRKKEYVEILAEKLKYSTGKFVPVYTRNENGRAFILKCRKGAYITYNQKMMNKKYKVRRWE